MSGIPQAQHPHGFVGHIFGALMDFFNAPAARELAALATPRSTNAILEIGFGTGHLLRRCARQMKRGKLAGIDPSPLMLRTAARRMRRFERKLEIDLKLAAADALDWPAASFDKALALHSFQFWAEPEAAAREIARVLKPGGALLIGLRDHSSRAPAWLPNPISRSGHEIDGALALLSQNGFPGAQHVATVGSTAILAAMRMA